MPGGVSGPHILIPDAAGHRETSANPNARATTAELPPNLTQSYSPGVGSSPGFTPLYQPSQPPVTAITS
jgi:hypothetical protein